MYKNREGIVTEWEIKTSIDGNKPKIEFIANTDIVLNTTGIVNRFGIFGFTFIEYKYDCKVFIVIIISIKPFNNKLIYN